MNAEKPIFQLIAKDISHDSEGWRWMAVIHFTGELARDVEIPSRISDEQIREVYQFLEGYGIYVRSAGSGGAGQRFANEPYSEWFPNHIYITQGGGLDV